MGEGEMEQGGMGEGGMGEEPTCRCLASAPKNCAQCYGQGQRYHYLILTSIATLASSPGRWA